MVGVSQGVLAYRLGSLFSKIGPAMCNILWQGCILILYTQYSTSRQADFSPNINGLDIVAQGCLTGHFMPYQECLVELVKDLVIGYIQDINRINLLTLPMTDDLSNSNASVVDPGLLK